MLRFKYFFLIICFFLLIVPSNGFAKEIDSLDELIKKYDSTRCKPCHEEIYNDWEKSLHSKPMVGPFGKTLGTLQDYLKQRDGELKKSHEVTESTKEYMIPCFICHIPQLEDATEKVAKEIADAVLKENYDVLDKLQINCIICHNRNAIVRKFRDGLPEKNVVYGTKDIGGAHPDSVFTKSKVNSMIADSSFCGGCHQGPNVLNSPEPFWCVSNYDSLLQNYIPNGGDKSCQDCHMRAPDTGHRFPPNYDDTAFEMKRLKEHFKFELHAMAYTFQIKTPKLVSIPMVVVKTKTIPVELGHRMPDGCPSPTHFDMNVIVKAKDGKEIFNETRYYMPQKKLGYAENKMVFASFRKISLMRDTALQPFKTNEENFEIKLPAGVEEATVEASLKLVVEPGVATSTFDLYKLTKHVSIKGN